MRHFIKICQKHKRPLVTAVLLTAILFASLVPGGSFMARAKDSDEGYSLFDKASIIANTMEEGFLDKVKSYGGVNSSSYDKWNIPKAIYGPGHEQAGNGGAFMGFTQDNEGRILGGIRSILSQGVETLDYNSIKGAPYGYAMYGYVLSYLNLYETKAGVGFSFNRVILGNLLKLVYQGYQVVPLLFGMAVQFMKATNPFALFMIPINGLAEMGPNNPLRSAAEYVKQLYDGVQNLSIFLVVPVMIALAAVMGVLSRKKDGVKKQFFKIVLRIAIIAIGVPLIGSFYTSAINQMSDVEGGKGVASRIVAATLFDFESWAKNQRLSPPEDIKWVGTPRNGTFEYTGKPAQDIALEVNHWNGIGPGNGIVFDPITMEKQAEDADPQTDDKAVADMLERYCSGAMFTSSDYNSLVSHETQDDADNGTPAQKGLVKQMLEIGSSSFKNTEDVSTNLLMPKAETNIFNNGGLSVSMDQSDHSDRSVRDTEERHGASYMGFQDKGGLSTISLYNFLNTEFTKGSMMLYAPPKSTSLYTRSNPLSVTAVGTGIGAALNTLNAISQISAMTVLGIVYGLGMMLSQLKRGCSLITHIPSTLMGSLHGFAKMLKIVVLMLSCVFFTMVFYLFMLELTMAIGGIFTNALNYARSIHPVAESLVGIMQPIFAIVLYIFVLWFGIKNRKKFLKGMGEIMEHLTDKFIKSLDASPREEHPEARRDTLPAKILQGAGAVGGVVRMKDMYDRHMGKDAGKREGTDGSGTRSTIHGKASSAAGNGGNQPPPPGAPPDGGKGGSKEASPSDRRVQEEAERLIRDGGIAPKAGHSVTHEPGEHKDVADEQHVSTGLEQNFADIRFDDKPYDPADTDVIQEEEIKEEAKKIRAKGFTDTASGAVKAGTGAARIAGGDLTGIKGAADGLTQAAKGTRTVKDKESAAREAKNRVKTGQTDHRSVAGAAAGNAAGEIARGGKNAVTGRTLPGRGKASPGGAKAPAKTKTAPMKKSRQAKQGSHTPEAPFRKDSSSKTSYREEPLKQEPTKQQSSSQTDLMGQTRRRMQEMQRQFAMPPYEERKRDDPDIRSKKQLLN